MKTELDSSQVEFYKENGFLHIPGFLESDELHSLKNTISTSLEELGERRVAGDDEFEFLFGSDFYDNVFTQRLNLWKVSSEIKAFITNQKLGEMFKKLGKTEGYRVWHDQALIKPPYSNYTAFHLDNPYWSFHSHQALTIWVALDDATIQNGCLYFIPGSHKLVQFENSKLGDSFGDLMTLYPSIANIAPFAAEMKAGDCSIHNGLTAHGAGVNATLTTRGAFTCAYMPVGSSYNGQDNILPKAYSASLNIGDELNEDSINPRVGEQRFDNV